MLMMDKDKASAYFCPAWKSVPLRDGQQWVSKSSITVATRRDVIR